MYDWIVFLHIAGTFGFLLAHGASMSVSYALLREKNLERIRALLELSGNSFRLMYLSLYALLISGIIAGFMGRWWGRGWIWASLALLVAIIVAMAILGGRIYGGARKAGGLPYFERGKVQPPQETVNLDEMHALLAQGKPHLLALIGYGGILVIAWLMMFKPF